ncbi:efflux RND transporter periplasmic adaptor subunit [Kineobactrum sediminis]|uniref:Efflux RND transporter periplasmic adaptor subunit n=1 Tax=Kineobactrum sediminis TaxID=1905677 RepID=A0A2N5Y642_9GAMM|nr:efflux RND transporter periplasmic adaptor subunit [Kineobactrum sediminis]PLW83865.1 efflux RND transporter periplasmic adaptor subunit [Kineobactrum sediminis]
MQASTILSAEESTDMTAGNNTSLDDMEQQVRAAIRSGNRRSVKTVAGWSLAGIAIVGVLAWWLWPTDQTNLWREAVVDRGDMVLTVTATGNLEPKSEVTVGAEISGLIREVKVIENDRVTAGRVLARFDTEELQVNLQQAQARLAVARARVAEARATREEARLNRQRIQALVARGTASQADLDSREATYQRATAQLALARASVKEAEAAVSAARTRLEKAVITSPIDGVVLLRSVEPGNTVAANFQTPELFVLAEDLRQMELHVSLDEADVAMAEAGQPATFTVDAWPDREFGARVLTVYLYPTVENNVVTYTTLLSVDNTELLLRPGMTATATIITGTREQALRVPNVALRFQPPVDGRRGGILSGPPGTGVREPEQGPGNTLWVLRNNQPTRIAVRTGYSDGRYTELLGDALQEGDRVLIGVQRTSAQD